MLYRQIVTCRYWALQNYKSAHCRVPRKILGLKGLFVTRRFLSFQFIEKFQEVKEAIQQSGLGTGGGKGGSTGGTHNNGSCAVTPVTSATASPLSHRAGGDEHLLEPPNGNTQVLNNHIYWWVWKRLRMYTDYLKNCHQIWDGSAGQNEHLLECHNENTDVLRLLCMVRVKVEC